MKKRLLIILPFLPYPLESGGQTSVFEMIDYLRKKNDISILVPWSDSVNTLKKIWPNVAIYYFKNNLRKKIVRKLLKYVFDAFVNLYQSSFKLLALPFFSRNNFFFDVDPDVIKLANKLVREIDFDFVQVEFFENLPLVCFLPPNTNSIFVHHEIRFVRNQRLMDLSKNDDLGFKNYFFHQIKGQELELLSLYKKIITVSDNDKKILSNYLNHDKIISSPLIIKSNFESKDNYCFENKLFFLGGSDHNPNVNALEWFLENCWNEILSKNAELKLIVIGSWHNTIKVDLNKKTPNLEFSGFVDKLGDVFKNGILIVPIWIGSGMRMKIIDAVNFGVPFITTTIGVEGLNFVDGKDCFIADDADSFVNKINQLILSDKLQKQFIANAKQVLDESYSYQKLMDTRESVYL